MAGRAGVVATECEPICIFFRSANFLRPVPTQCEPVVPMAVTGWGLIVALLLVSCVQVTAPVMKASSWDFRTDRRASGIETEAAVGVALVTAGAIAVGAVFKMSSFRFAGGRTDGAGSGFRRPNLADDSTDFRGPNPKAARTSQDGDRGDGGERGARESPRRANFTS